MMTADYRNQCNPSIQRALIPTVSRGLQRRFEGALGAASGRRPRWRIVVVRTRGLCRAVNMVHSRRRNDAC